MDLKEINGNEIIDFLNNLSEDDNDVVENIYIVEGTYKFVKQEIKDDKYMLEFTAGFNNWGTVQEIDDNRIKISIKNNEFVVECWPNEPFDGDGSAEIIDELLMEWLKNHKFVDSSSTLSNFNEIIENAQKNLSELKFDDKKKLQSIIDKLNKAKTLQK
jgi:hypothetical protein